MRSTRGGHQSIDLNSSGIWTLIGPVSSGFALIRSVYFDRVLPRLANCPILPNTAGCLPAHEALNHHMYRE
jgi:hypothetical protein